MGNSVSCFDPVREHPPYSWPKDHPGRQQAIDERRRARKNQKIVGSQGNARTVPIDPLKPVDAPPIPVDPVPEEEASLLTADAQTGQEKAQEAQDEVNDLAEEKKEVVEEATNQVDEQIESKQLPVLPVPDMINETEEKVLEQDVEKHASNMDGETNDQVIDDQVIDKDIGIEATPVHENDANDDGLVQHIEEEMEIDPTEQPPVILPVPVKGEEEKEEEQHVEEERKLMEEMEDVQDEMKQEEEKNMKYSEEEEEKEESSEKVTLEEEMKHNETIEKAFEEAIDGQVTEEEIKEEIIENVNVDDDEKIINSTEISGVGEESLSIDTRRAMFDKVEDELPEAKDLRRDVWDPVTKEFVSLDEFRKRQTEQTQGSVKEKVEKFEEIDDERSRQLAEHAAIEAARAEAIANAEWRFKHKDRLSESGEYNDITTITSTTAELNSNDVPNNSNDNFENGTNEINKDVIEPTHNPNVDQVIEQEKPIDLLSGLLPPKSNANQEAEEIPELPKATVTQITDEIESGQGAVPLS